MHRDARQLARELRADSRINLKADIDELREGIRRFLLRGTVESDGAHENQSALASEEFARSGIPGYPYEQRSTPYANLLPTSSSGRFIYGNIADSVNPYEGSNGPSINGRYLLITDIL